MVDWYGRTDVGDCLLWRTDWSSVFAYRYGRIDIMWLCIVADELRCSDLDERLCWTVQEVVLHLSLYSRRCIYSWDQSRPVHSPQSGAMAVIALRCHRTTLSSQQAATALDRGILLDLMIDVQRLVKRARCVCWRWQQSLPKAAEPLIKS